MRPLLPVQRGASPFNVIQTVSLADPGLYEDLLDMHYQIALGLMELS